MEKANGVPYVFSRGGAAERQYIGAAALDWFQGELHQIARRERQGRLSKYGLIVSSFPDGTLGDEWLVTESGTAGYLELGDGVAYQSLIDSEGYLVTVEGGYEPRTTSAPWTRSPLVANDGVWRTLVVRRTITQYEPGTLTFNSTATVIGSGTKFTRYAAKTSENLDKGTYLRVDSADNATLGALTLQIDTIVSDTELTLVTAPAVSVGSIPFTIRGNWATTEPADLDVHNFLVPELELVTRTREPSDPDDFVLADVMRTGGTMTIIDRRVMSLARFKDPTRRAVFLTPQAEPATASPYTAMSLQPLTISTGGALSSIRKPDITTIGFSDGRNGLMVAYHDDTANFIRSRTLRFSTPNASWSSSTNITADTNTGGHTIVHVVGPSGNVNYCFYAENGILYQRSSTDNGATWGAGSAIWDPTAVDASDGVVNPRAIFLLNHRIVVYASYFDDSASIYYLRAIYSDDYGSTWSNNTNAGHDVMSVASPAAADGVTSCAVTQDGQTGAIWIIAEGVKSGTEAIWMSRSSSPLGISGFTPFNTTGSAARILNVALAETSFDGLTGWVSNDGALHCILALFRNDVAGADGYIDLQYVIAEIDGDGTVSRIYDRRLLRLEDSAHAGGGDVHGPTSGLVAMAPGPDGRVHVVYVDPDQSADTETLLSLPLLPVMLAMTTSGYNGMS